MLAERVTVGSDGMAVDPRTAGLGSIVRAMVTPRRQMAAIADLPWADQVAAAFGSSEA